MTEVSTTNSFEYWQLPKEYKVELVASPQSLQNAQKVLKSCNQIAFDAEWKPGSKDPQATLLQIATRNKDLSQQFVFLLDLLQLDGGSVNQVVNECFLNEKILKVGYGLVQDVLAVSRSIGKIGCLQSHLDLKLLHKSLSRCSAAKLQTVAGCGLSALVCSVLGVPLDKEMQCSDWHERPLTENQIQYAAKDAAVLLALLDKLIEYAPPEKFCMVEKDQFETEIDDLIIRNWGSKIEFSDTKIRRSGWLGVGGKTENEELDPEMIGRPFRIPWENNNNPKFICDSMMEGLARMLRSCGVDTACVDTKTRVPRHQIYRQMKDQAEEEQRVILTGDRTFVRANYSDHSYLVKSNNKKHQLIEVLKFFKVVVEADNLLSRCNKCNGQFLPPLTAEDLPPSLCISEATLKHQKLFWMCGVCNQVYWPGNMYDNAILSLSKNLERLKFNQ
eukprot:TRINITY_DN12138_c1_g1_i1.p1 TRINITY_DN12138_c1_g1~~TRINITY_DN12138_c1_g1_i1.p1  ORF type:complete len:445 (-),score=48.95 TRINITY_DN12138_c1_g1_i1:382-1716(-)